MTEKFFTPKEANELLPQVKIIVRDMLVKAGEMRHLLSIPVADDIAQQRVMELDNQIKHLMSTLEHMGCYYKDWNFDIGLVDFPAIIHGQEALLCWRSDEPSVTWFHGMDDGFAGRRPITQHLVFS